MEIEDTVSFHTMVMGFVIVIFSLTLNSFQSNYGKVYPFTITLTAICIPLLVLFYTHTIKKRKLVIEKIEIKKRDRINQAFLQFKELKRAGDYFQTLSSDLYRLEKAEKYLRIDRYLYWAFFLSVLNNILIPFVSGTEVPFIIIFFWFVIALIGKSIVSFIFIYNS